MHRWPHGERGKRGHTGEGGHNLAALQAIEDGGLASTVQAEDEDSYVLVPSKELRKEAREEITWVQSSRNL